MDYDAAIKALRAEMDQIDYAIAQLESLNSPEELQTASRPKRRGRKWMGETERRQVSERMKRYWAARRKR